MTVTELLSDRSRWTTEYTARDINGKQVPALSDQAVCWCAYGAIEKCYGKGSEKEALDATLKLLVEMKSNLLVSIFDANDSGYDIIYPLIVKAGI